MNNTFNIRRFGLIVRKDCIENWKRYALMFLMMTGCLAIVLIFISISGYHDGVRLINDGEDITAISFNKSLLSAVSIMFPIFGVLFASLLMNPMNDKVNRIAYLTIPASNLEKFLTRWITMTIGYIIAFFVALWIVELVRVGICSVKYPNIDVTFLDLSKLIYSGQGGNVHNLFDNKQYFVFALSIYFLCQSLMILGSTFWEKATFIKTFAAIIIIGLAYWLICYLAIDLFYNDFNQFGHVSHSLADEFINEETIKDDDPPMYIAATLFFFTLANWTLAYLRFRESEIIKRL